MVVVDCVIVNVPPLVSVQPEVPVTFQVPVMDPLVSVFVVVAVPVNAPFNVSVFPFPCTVNLNVPLT